ncbi:hypothetical protein [uncultured Cocleimonas sp.]|uniref:ApeI family dehydratase n=1 Tax=uncultured Cocleimonas sp. TaxID=1051587 RepID=UPI002631352F|nr:hypothetical protein [uncultured Cocleimonas sp.]
MTGINLAITAEELNQQYPEKDKWPTFSVCETPSTLATDNSYEVICDIPVSLSYFKGHFPDQAVLPGVVQINWANDLAKRLFKYEEFRGVNSLKFNTMILPETKVILSLTLNPEKHTVKFRYTSITEDDSMTEEKDEILFSSGILVFSEAK